jgi:hypothetical protein
MTFDLIATHIQDEREAALAYARLEQLVRDGRRPTIVARGRAAVGRGLIALGQALGGDALRPGRQATTAPGGM